MIPKDLHNTLSYLTGLAPAANTDLGTTSLTTAIIDMADAVGLEFVIQTGTLSDADAVYAVTVQHGDAVDSESSPTSITDSAEATGTDLYGTLAAAGFTFANDGVVRSIGYAGIKRWVKLTITPTTTANSGNTPVSVLVVKKPRVVGTAN